jgi:hypothetical protein
MDIDIVGDTKTPFLAELDFENSPLIEDDRHIDFSRGYEPAAGGREPIFNT